MTVYKRAIIISSSFVAIAWLVHIIDYFFNLELWLYGLYPRSLEGLLGILFTPFLHGDWGHLAANTPPMAVMIGLLFYGYPKSATLNMIGVWIASGLLAWIFARSHIHIGFSGINHGLMFFLFTIGVLRRDNLSIALSMIVFFMYGGMIWSVFPDDPKISFELHFFGAVSGIMMAFLLRNRDKPAAKKTYSWENETATDVELENDLIGDEWMHQQDNTEEIEHK